MMIMMIQSLDLMAIVIIIIITTLWLDFVHCLIKTQHCENDITEICCVCLMGRMSFYLLGLPEEAVLFIAFCILIRHWMKSIWSALVRSNYNEDNL